NDYDSIITVGGDGTFFETLNGYYQNENKKKDINFGVLPIGTGNSLSKDVYQNDYSLERYIEIIAQAKTKAFDIAKYKNNGTEMYYANTLGFGFVSDVVLTANNFKYLGKFAYTIGVLHKTILLSTHDMKLVIDGNTFDMNNVFVSISNTRYTGGNYLIAPNASVSDGKLDLIIVNKLSRYNLLKTFPKIFTGEHINSKYVETMQAENIRIETSKPKILSPDGELFGNTPLNIECLKGAINIITDL
ncbi:MAG: YegS/Rv2252/BmrU family lipid kinase, partial [Bacteroidales bacterium]|nr:YegS/Rv2252/BmrU family lipid kinase [Bacteroidales bacterium]